MPEGISVSDEYGLSPRIFPLTVMWLGTVVALDPGRATAARRRPARRTIRRRCRPKNWHLHRGDVGLSRGDLFAIVTVGFKIAGPISRRGHDGRDGRIQTSGAARARLAHVAARRSTTRSSACSSSSFPEGLRCTIIIAGILETLTFMNLLFIVLGVVVGIIVGAIPGLNGPMAIAVALPITFYMSPLAALAFLIGISKGSMFGGSISAILINTPGTPEAAPTAFDGYPMTQQGKGLKALKMSLYASVIGATASDLVLFITAAPAAVLALMMGPPEMTAVLLFSFTIIAGLAGNSLLRGSIAAIFGAFLGIVGPRSGIGAAAHDLRLRSICQDGFPLIPLTIGLLALSEIIIQIEQHMLHGDASGKRADAFAQGRPAGESHGHAGTDWRSCFRSIWRSSLIGIAIGALPGVGAIVAGFLGYASAKRASPRAANFGKGEIEGVAATEAANNAVIGSGAHSAARHRRARQSDRHHPDRRVPDPRRAARALDLQGLRPAGLWPVHRHGARRHLQSADRRRRPAAVRARAERTQAVLYPVIIVLCIAGAYSSDNSLFGVASRVDLCRGRLLHAQARLLLRHVPDRLRAWPPVRAVLPPDGDPVPGPAAPAPLPSDRRRLRPR